ncbi:MAG TPA: hypothetical protein VG994_18735 [Steroidobacteraceae bacterium]|nr:hypothetical protein [Steroidobacteraceae bacterium]
MATAFALTHLHLTQLELMFAVLVPLCLLAVQEDCRKLCALAAGSLRAAA